VAANARHRFACLRACLKFPCRNFVSASSTPIARCSSPGNELLLEDEDDVDVVATEDPYDEFGDDDDDGGVRVEVLLMSGTGEPGLWRSPFSLPTIFVVVAVVLLLAFVGVDAR